MSIEPVPLDLGLFNAVYCDSTEALAHLRAKGLPADAAILTNSPALLRADTRAVATDALAGRARLRDFITALNSFVLGAYLELAQRLDNHDQAVAAAFGLYTAQQLLYNALALREADLIEPRLIVMLKSDDPALERVFASHWPELLAVNPQCRTVEFKVKTPEHGRSFGGRPPDLLTRIGRLRSDRLLYRLVLRLHQHLPRQIFRRSDVLVVRDSNEYVRDVALRFALSGHRLVPMTPPGARVEELDPALRTAVEAAVGAVFDDAFPAVFLAGLVAYLKTRMVEAACREIAIAKTSDEGWTRALAPYRTATKDNRPLVLHGAPMGGTGAGLHAAASRNNIPVVSFQHGVRREIADWPLDGRILNENNYGELVICYNRYSAAYSQETNRFAIGDAVPVGMPSDYAINFRAASDPAEQPIIYISTLLYRGYRQIINTPLSDAERADQEIGLINDVLANLPHRVLFKPYPSLRYPDPDPAIAAARAADNLTVFESETDLRYMIQRHRVAITSGATSTVGWCALSGLPLVYIDYPDVMPLNAHAREMFARAFFLFDGAASDLHVRLRDFLSRPIGDIEQAALEKADARRHLLDETLGFNGTRSARQAAELIRRRFMNT